MVINDAKQISVLAISLLDSRDRDAGIRASASLARLRIKPGEEWEGPTQGAGSETGAD